MLQTKDYVTFEAMNEIEKLHKEVEERYDRMKSAARGAKLKISTSQYQSESSSHDGPDPSLIVPFSRIKLLVVRIRPIDHPSPLAADYYAESWALVVDVNGDRIDAYVCHPNDTPHGRISVSVEQEIEVLPPLDVGRIEPLQPSEDWDDIPFQPRSP